MADWHLLTNKPEFTVRVFFSWGWEKGWGFRVWICWWVKRWLLICNNCLGAYVGIQSGTMLYFGSSIIELECKLSFSSWCWCCDLLLYWCLSIISIWLLYETEQPLCCMTRVRLWTLQTPPRWLPPDGIEVMKCCNYCICVELLVRLLEVLGLSGIWVFDHTLFPYDLTAKYGW